MDFELIRGDTYCALISVIDKVTNKPVDITGYTIRFTARHDGSDAPTSDSDDNDAPIHIVQTIHSNPTAGETEIVLTSEDTNVEPGKYNYDVQWSDESKVPPVVGSKKPSKLEVIADVTRAD